MNCTNTHVILRASYFSEDLNKYGRLIKNKLHLPDGCWDAFSLSAAKVPDFI